MKPTRSLCPISGQINQRSVPAHGAASNVLQTLPPWWYGPHLCPFHFVWDDRTQGLVQTHPDGGLSYLVRRRGCHLIRAWKYGLIRAQLWHCLIPSRFFAYTVFHSCLKLLQPLRPFGFCSAFFGNSRSRFFQSRQAAKLTKRVHASMAPICK